MERGDGGASGRAALVSGWGGNEEGGDDDRAHIQLNIYALLWRIICRFLADRSRVFLGVTVMAMQGPPPSELKQAVGLAAMCLQENHALRPVITDVVVALSFLLGCSSPPSCC